jgi:hypothetical protein
MIHNKTASVITFGMMGRILRVKGFGPNRSENGKNQKCKKTP